MQSTWTELATQAVTIISGIIFAAVSTMGAFYIKRLTDKLKKKSLIDEINRYVQWAEQAKSFKMMTGEEKQETVLAKAREFAMENEIKVSIEELKLLVERSVQSLVKLENMGLKLLNLKLAKANSIKTKGEK